ncbi:hypothetical protein ASPACDRAFT_1854247 [Aspergillus aculeatus ATCC 16872]|uniref:Uncharacterized protein n=1 Tax=Aspergillus aculeatus (strain ATCC 16872 / CBS 172.66 / WB 5094) TaxID=690307 RepID=A0A1L9X1M6_ASPA1|nr:uncharacterized protein ASPACDRAFT_1854247 [Aspergillus aculeatus ATCC 16872]OJK02266.1 hypothetical protein ASPACDRAFT_1854247 [Aspergillus aculeatus ATCC 16872]
MTKYVYKDPDRTKLYFRAGDEIEQYLESQYIGPTEAAVWLLRFRVHEEYLSSTTLFAEKGYTDSSQNESIQMWIQLVSISADRDAAKHVLRYLKGSTFDVVYGSGCSKQFEVYVDASYADDDDRKSMEAYVITYAGSPVSWATRKQAIMASSATLSGYIACGEANREAVFLRESAMELGLPVGDKAASLPEDISESSVIRLSPSRPAFHRTAAEDILQLRRASILFELGDITKEELQDRSRADLYGTDTVYPIFLKKSALRT